MELHLKIAGFILIILAFIHIIFPRYFSWKKELVNLSIINSQMMYVHTFFIALTVFLMGILCIYSSSDLVHTKLGNQVAIGLFIFWFMRLITQFFICSSKLWKGKNFETIIHIIFSALWIYLTLVFFCVYYLA